MIGSYLVKVLHSYDEEYDIYTDEAEDLCVMKIVRELKDNAVLARDIDTNALYTEYLSDPRNNKTYYHYDSEITARQAANNKRSQGRN